MNTGRPVHWDWDAVRSVALTSRLSLAEVARQFGIPYNSVKSKARREGWAINQVFGKKFPTQKERLPHTIQAMKKTVGELVAENGAASRIHLSQAIRRGTEHLGGLEGSEVVERHVAVNSLAKSAATVHGWDDPKRAEGNVAILNLQFLSTRPQVLATRPAREVEANGSSPPEPLLTVPSEAACGPFCPSATERSGQGVGPSPTAPKTAPEVPQNALKHSVQASVQEPPPLSPQERRRRELEELARLRAEWRGR